MAEAELDHGFPVPNHEHRSDDSAGSHRGVEYILFDFLIAAFRSLLGNSDTDAWIGTLCYQHLSLLWTDEEEFQSEACWAEIVWL
jgi:hypothetical protein